MSKELSLFDTSKAAIPAYLANLGDGSASNIDAVSGVPSLSIRGKVFRIQKDGEETMITRMDADVGEQVPVNILPVIILNQGPFGARVFFGRAYDSEDSSAPKCFSLDGKHPDSRAGEPQAGSCADCEHAVKGSKVSLSGQPTTACAFQRRLAIVPASKPDSTPLLLRLAPTSAYDPETKNSADNWFGWRQYLDFVAARGVKHTAQVVTKLRFDSKAEHPKLLFRPDRFLTEEEAKIVGPRIDSEEVKDMLFPSEELPFEPVKPVKPVPGAALLPPDEEGEAEELPKVERKPAPIPKPTEVVNADEAPAKPARKVSKAAPAAEKPAASAAPGASVASLLDEWAAE